MVCGVSIAASDAKNVDLHHPGRAFELLVVSLHTKLCKFQVSGLNVPPLRLNPGDAIGGAHLIW